VPAGERRAFRGLSVFAGGFDLAEGLGHAVESKLMQQIEGGMGEQGLVSYW